MNTGNCPFKICYSYLYLLHTLKTSNREETFIHFQKFDQKTSCWKGIKLEVMLMLTETLEKSNYNYKSNLEHLVNNEDADQLIFKVESEDGITPSPQV